MLTLHIASMPGLSDIILRLEFCLGETMFKHEHDG